MKLTLGHYLGPWALILIITSLGWWSSVTPVKAESWNGIEPFKSRRQDVLRILGTAISESSEGALRFKVAGGTVLVSFVDEKFVRAKKLRPELIGTVLEIVLQHEHSSETPDSLGVAKDRAFVRDNMKSVSVFRNLRKGIVYTFVDGKLKTSRFTFADGQLARVRS
jgi:hypothetical protein